MTLLSYQVFLAVVEQQSFQNQPCGIIHGIGAWVPAFCSEPTGGVSDQLRKGTVSLY